MSDTIRETILTAIETKLAEALISNGYNTDIGQHVYRGQEFGLELDFVNFKTEVEEADRDYRNSVCTMRLNFEAAVSYVESENASKKTEKMLGDLKEVVSGQKWTVAFTSGGTYKVQPGQTVTGASSGATALVESVSVSGGSWSGGSAAGTLTLRRRQGTFESENLDVGANSNVCTIDGDLTHYSSESLLSGGVTIDDVKYIGGGTRSFPEAGDFVVGCFAEFNIVYRTLEGNPYNQ